VKQMEREKQIYFGVVTRERDKKPSARRSRSDPGSPRASVWGGEGGRPTRGICMTMKRRGESPTPDSPVGGIAKSKTRVK